MCGGEYAHSGEVRPLGKEKEMEKGEHAFGMRGVVSDFSTLISSFSTDKTAASKVSKQHGATVQLKSLWNT